MTPTSHSKALALIDEARGKILASRSGFPKGSLHYNDCSLLLRYLNRLKKEFTDLLDTDEPPLGL
jgi:hypothetical protein